MQSPHRWVAGTACALLVCSVATAGTISFTDASSLHAASWSEALVVPQFDASLGTLSAISVTVDTDFSGEFRIENTADRTASAYAEVDLDLAIYGPDGDVLLETNYFESSACDARSVRRFA